MQTFPNQNRVTIYKPTYEKGFLQISIEEWQKAIQVLSKSVLKLYFYLASNADGYTFALSKQDIMNCTGISRTRYYEAVKELKEHYYLIDDGYNHLSFFLSPNPEYAKAHNPVWFSE